MREVVKHVTQFEMSRPLTIRDLRLNWHEAERRLRQEREIVVTRHGQPVAMLSIYEPKTVRRPRWSAKRHLAWLARTWKSGRAGPSTDELLAKDRGE